MKAQHLMAEGVVMQVRRLTDSRSGIPRFSVQILTAQGKHITVRSHYEVSQQLRVDPLLEGHPVRVIFTPSGALQSLTRLDEGQP